MKDSKKTYKPKPFTQDVAADTMKHMNQSLDDKRTLCNVLKQAYRCVQVDSHNLIAAQHLLLEALWMGKRMHEKLYDDKKQELNNELIDDSEDICFEIDWQNMDGRNVARGNWD